MNGEYKNEIKLSGEAFKLFENFLKYAELQPEEVASALMYDKDGFKKALRQMKRQTEDMYF